MYSNAHEVSHIKRLKTYDKTAKARLTALPTIKVSSLVSTLHEVMLAVGIVALGVLAVAILSTIPVL